MKGIRIIDPATGEPDVKYEDQYGLYDSRIRSGNLTEGRKNAYQYYDEGKPILKPTTIAKCKELIQKHKKIIKTAYVEYEKIEELAYVEYNKIEQQAFAEYKKIILPAFAEYQKIEESALAEFEKKVTKHINCQHGLVAIENCNLYFLTNEVILKHCPDIDCILKRKRTGNCGDWAVHSFLY